VQHDDPAPKPRMQSAKSSPLLTYVRKHWALMSALGAILIVSVGVLANISGSMYFLTGRSSLCDFRHFPWCSNQTDTAGTTPIATSQPTATVWFTATTISSSPTPSIVGAHSEQEGNLGANTFSNYHNATGPGTKIGAWQWVQVSCKVYDPTIPSVTPDGYWYRIASPPWENAYYAAANTFMNGGTLSGPGVINTDVKVPNC
jgi:hypothetical protein